MKKNLLVAAMTVAMSMSFVGCNSDNPEPTVIPMILPESAVIVNTGSSYNKIPGSLTVIDYAKESASQRAFYKANGVEVGDTPNDALVHGSKMYIAVTESNLVWVVDRKTMQIIGQPIRPEEGKGKPRQLVGFGGNVYVSMMDGYVARIDTASLAINRTIETGANPEGMTIAGRALYVANSDGYGDKNHSKSSVSVINIDTFTKMKDINVGMNPTELVTNGQQVYVLCMGNYDDVKATAKIIAGDRGIDMADATMMAMSADGKELLLINAPYGSTDPVTYRRYSTESGYRVGDITTDPVDYPAAMGVDPVSGNIFITSYRKTASGYADYSADGYVKVYGPKGDYLHTFDAGLNPNAIAFNYGLGSVTIN